MHRTVLVARRHFFKQRCRLLKLILIQIDRSQILISSKKPGVLFQSCSQKWQCLHGLGKTEIAVADLVISGSIVRIQTKPISQNRDRLPKTSRPPELLAQLEMSCRVARIYLEGNRNWRIAASVRLRASSICA